MRRADSEARGNEFIAGVYSSWVWPRMQWVREQLVSLAEFDFEVIPPDVETACYAKWRGYQQTVIVEDGFNVLENATRETKNHALSRTSRWWRLVSSQVLKNYDRDDVKAASAAEVCETELTNTFFSAKDRGFSMGNDKLEKLSLPEWSSPSPESWDLAAASLLALRCVGSDSNKLEAAWVSLLVPDGGHGVQAVHKDDCLFAHGDEVRLHAVARAGSQG